METGRHKIRIGRVVSDKMDKTRVVAIEQLTRHPFYGKIIRRTKRFKFHDEYNRSRTGDLVRIVETRPLSKQKHWALVEILEKSQL